MAGEFDQEVLTTAIQRKPALEALAQEPHHREELQEELSLSKTTCHRIVRTFDERGLLRRTDQGYSLTALGELVYERVDEFDESVRRAYRLQPLLETFDDTDIKFEVEPFLNATVTTPEPGDPYPFIDRTLELFRESRTIRVVDCNPLVPPVYVEQMLDIALETGMHGEFVVTKEIALGNMEQFSERQKQVADSDDTSGRYLVHDDIPFGLALYDDHLDLRIYDEKTGTPTLYVDTDDPDAIAWAESVYRQFRAEATPATTLEEFPDWAPTSGFDDQ